MVRSPAIRGRPAPERKFKSSTSGHIAAGASSSSPSSFLPQRTSATVSKALKRAQKRAQLLSKVGASIGDGDEEDDAEHKGARALLRTGGGIETSQLISKSALRRRKRKARDALAKDDLQGRQGGVADLQDAVDELVEQMEYDEDDDEEHDGVVRTSVGATKGGRVTTNHRKRVLEQEQQRQKAILANPAFQASPFAALREHARNAMASKTR